MRMKFSEFLLFFSAYTLLNIAIMSSVLYLCLDAVIAVFTGMNVDVSLFQSIAVAIFIITVRGVFMLKLESER